MKVSIVSTDKSYIIVRKLFVEKNEDSKLIQHCGALTPWANNVPEVSKFSRGLNSAYSSNFD